MRLDPAAHSVGSGISTRGELMATPATDTPLLDLVTTMTKDSIEAASLDARELMLARIAALVAVDAPPASYLLNLEAASDIGIEAEDVRGILLAVAPIVGTPRVVTAAGNIYRALGIALELEELSVEAKA
jgi:alkylhydroperoxidase/carboxymuconolactone decarboxylase family protein YurZ